MVNLPDPLNVVFNQKQVFDSSGDLRALDSNVSESEAAKLFEVTCRLAPQQSLEIGLAHGVSALAILGGIEKNGSGHHHIIDPFQSRYGYTGKTMIQRAGYDSLCHIYEKFSEEVIPSLTPIQFAFIDSSHLFDLTIAEFILIDKKLEVDGVIALHDLWMPSLQAVIRYILANRAYEICRDFSPGTETLSPRQQITEWVAEGIGKLPGAARLLHPNILKPWSAFRLDNLAFLRKHGDDKREWRFHKSF